MLILLCSFLDEWQRLEGIAKKRNDLLETVKIGRIAVNRIRQWKGLHRLRSSVLAHGFRGKDKKIVDVSTFFGPQQAPLNYAEVILLAECAVYAIATIICRHKDEAEEGLFIMDGFRCFDCKSDGIGTFEEFECEISRIENQIIEKDQRLASCFRGDTRNTAQ